MITDLLKSRYPSVDQLVWAVKSICTHSKRAIANLPAKVTHYSLKLANRCQFVNTTIKVNYAVKAPLLHHDIISNGQKKATHENFKKYIYETYTWSVQDAPNLLFENIGTNPNSSFRDDITIPVFQDPIFRNFFESGQVVIR